MAGFASFNHFCALCALVDMSKPIKIIDDGVSSVQLYSDWLKNADSYFERCLSEVDWQTRVISLFGKQHPIPREEAWVGDKGVGYRYSGQDYIANGWPASLDVIASNIQKEFAWAVNSALLNYYSDGQSSMGWHSDNEKELGECPMVVILSMGASRTIQFRQIKDHKLKTSVELEHGSLLVIRGETQHQWQHAIPKRAGKAARVSCTFRKVIT
jgi:alkylated DNA repair dioxygenase AlkB